MSELWCPMPACPHVPMALLLGQYCTALLAARGCLVHALLVLRSTGIARHGLVPRGVLCGGKRKGTYLVATAGVRRVRAQMWQG